MTRVLMLTCQYMPDVFGGAEKQCQRVATEMAAQGHQVTILTSTQTASARGHQREGLLDVHRLYTGVAPDLLGRWLPFSAWWWTQVMRWAWARRHQFDVIHCHQGKFGAFVGVSVGQWLRLPVIVKIGNSEDDMDLRCLQRKAVVGAPMARHVLRRRPTFIAISQVIERNLRAYGCQDVVMIPNGIPVPAVPMASPPPAVDHTPFFYHGRIEPIKRLDVLIQAFNTVIKTHPHVQLHIVGDGSDLPRIQHLTQALSLTPLVHFHGQVDDPTTLINAFDIFVNASRAEGFSNSLLEALLLGKVLVSTPVSGASEVILPEHNGALSAGFTADELATAMRSALALCASPERDRVRSVCSRLVHERFAMGKVAAQYDALYGQLISKEIA